MTGVATAIGAAAVVGAGATVYGASEASNATKNAANTAANAQLTAQQNAIAQEQPYNQAGQSAIPQLQALLGLTSSGGPTSAATNANTLQTLQNTPGYQFAQQQGLQGVTNQASAQGLLGSGNTLQALDQYSTGLADQTYQNQVGNLQNLVNTGQGAAAGVAGTIENTGNNLANIAVGQGNNLANIDVNEVAGLSRLAGNAANSSITANTLAGLNNPGYNQYLTNAMSQGAVNDVIGSTSPTLLNLGGG